jgi:hypothetical protein
MSSVRFQPLGREGQAKAPLAFARASGHEPTLPYVSEDLTGRTSNSPLRSLACIALLRVSAARAWKDITSQVGHVPI